MQKFRGKHHIFPKFTVSGYTLRNLGKRFIHLQKKNPENAKEKFVGTFLSLRCVFLMLTIDL